MNVAIVQFDIVWEDKPANHARVESMLDAAPPPRGSLIVLPEMSDTGFSFRLDVTADDATVPWASGLARRTGCWVQVGDAIRRPAGEGRGLNRTTLIDPEGTALGAYHKVFPFSFGREVEFFDGGDRLLVGPIGTGDDRLVTAPLICYDLRFPELFRLATLAGAELITVPASWPAPRTHHWRSLLIARAIENQAFVVGVNRTGRDPHLSYAGASIAVAPDGEVLFETGDEPGVHVVELDPARLRAWRSTFPALADVRPDLLGRIEVDRFPGTGSA